MLVNMIPNSFDPPVDHRGHHLPHRFREVSFRKYERVVAAIITAFPKPLVLSPGDLSSATFIARLRDAMTSYAKHHWPTALFTAEQFALVRPQICICQKPDGTIIARPRGEDDDDTQPVGEFEVATKKEPFQLDILDDSQLRIIFSLAHHRQLIGPVKFTTLNEPLLQSLKDSYDVFVSPTANPNEYSLT